MPPRSAQQRLHDIRDAIDRILGFVANKSYADHAVDALLRGAVERNIEIISEASRHIRRNSRRDMPRSLGRRWPASAMSCGTAMTLSTIGRFGTPCKAILVRSGLPS
jgi:hypothetical protein